MMDELLQLCRVCLNGSSETKPLFEPETNNLAEKITFCTGVEFIKEEGSSSVICESCYGDLETAYKFKTACLIARDSYEKLLQSTVKLERFDLSEDADDCTDAVDMFVVNEDGTDTLDTFGDDYVKEELEVFDSIADLQSERDSVSVHPEAEWNTCLQNLEKQINENSQTAKRKQSREEKLEKKKLVERERKARIKSDPVLYERQKQQNRERYYRLKREGKIVPINEKPVREQKAIRAKNRESAKKHYYKKKLKEPPVVLSTSTNPMFQRKQSREEKLEKKKLAERERKEKIRSDPVRYERELQKHRERYSRLKSEGKIVPINEKPVHEQKVIRAKNRESAKKHYYKKKLKEPPIELSDNMIPNCQEDPLTFS